MSDKTSRELLRDAEEAPFEDWWEREGQFGRAGGGRYEKSFAWNAWCARACEAQAISEQGTPEPAERVADGEPECDCGCMTPLFTEPMEALRFLSARFKHAGVGDAVAEDYARDIDAILAKSEAPSDASVRLDAERFRWLRREHNRMVRAALGITDTMSLDAAIDAAIASKSGSKL